MFALKAGTVFKSRHFFQLVLQHEQAKFWTRVSWTCKTGHFCCITRWCRCVQYFFEECPTSSNVLLVNRNWIGAGNDPGTIALCKGFISPASIVYGISPCSICLGIAALTGDWG